MVRRGWIAALALALSACGVASRGQGLDVSLLVDGAVGNLDGYRIRVFGAQVRCSAVLASPAEFELGGDAVCRAAEADTSGRCLIAFSAFDASAGSDAIDDISPGQRAVFVEGVSGGMVVAHGCAAVTVVAGEAASATVTLQ